MYANNYLANFDDLHFLQTKQQIIKKYSLLGNKKKNAKHVTVDGLSKKLHNVFNINQKQKNDKGYFNFQVLADIIDVVLYLYTNDIVAFNFQQRLTNKNTSMSLHQIINFIRPYIKLNNTESTFWSNLHIYLDIWDPINQYQLNKELYLKKTIFLGYQNFKRLVLLLKQQNILLFVVLNFQLYLYYFIIECLNFI